TGTVLPLNAKRRSWEAGAARFWPALRGWKPAVPAPSSLFANIPDAWWNKTHLSAGDVGSLSLIVPAWFYNDRPQMIAILPPEMAKVETMFAFGSQALLDAAEFTILKNIIRRLIKQHRAAAAILRRAR